MSTDHPWLHVERGTAPLLLSIPHYAQPLIQVLRQTLQRCISFVTR